MKHYQTNVLVTQLKKTKVNAFTRLAAELERPTRQQRRVNVAKLNKQDDKFVLVVPGKVLGVGAVDKKLTVAAFGFSQEAKRKIEAAKGKTLDVTELIKKHPKAQNIKIIG